MFRNLLKPDSALMITMTQITDCIFLSMFWFLCCLPLVTVGASTAALYDAVYHTYRKEDKHGWQRFFRSFRSNLKGSVVSSLVFVGIAAGMVRGLIQLWNSCVYGAVSWGIFAGIAFLFFVLVGLLSIVFPMHSRFENPAILLWSNSLRLGLAKLPLTLGLSIINSVSIFLCIRYIFPLFFLPALACLLATLLLEPMFKPFMPSEDAA